MLADLRRSYASLLTSGGQVMLLMGGFALKTPMAWYVCLGLIAAVSLLAWLSVLRRWRMFTNLPQSSIATAAQGYVRLQGRGKPLDGLPLRAPMTGIPCLWYRLHTEQRNDNHHQWVSQATDESIASFQLDDGTGICVVDPEGAEILAVRKQVMEDGDYRYTLWTLIERDEIQVVGALKTDSTSHVDAAVSQAVGDLLAQWKEDRPRLLKRFDLNEDGEIDMREWELARAQARREVEQHRRQAIADHRDVHWLGRPTDGRIFLVSAMGQDKLMRRYAFWAWAQAAIFLAALGGMAAVP
jgi:hypothetical protein